MKRKIIYTDAPPEIEEALDRSVTVRDYLPPPSELILKVARKQDMRQQKGVVTPAYRRVMEYA